MKHIKRILPLFLAVCILTGGIWGGYALREAIPSYKGTITEANQNFSKITRLADKTGEVIIFKNNRPKYRLIDLEQNPDLELTEEEAIDIVAARILKRYRPAFEELAK